MVFIAGFNVVYSANASIIKFQNFLAEMSSSRSDVVTQCVRLFVLPSVRPFFFSFGVPGVSSSPKEFHWCFKAV